MKKIVILTSFVFIFICIYYYYFLSEPIYEDYYVKNAHRTIPKVYDVGHKYLPNIEKYQYLINIVIGIAILKLIFTPFIFDFLLLKIILLWMVIVTIKYFLGILL